MIVSVMEYQKEYYIVPDGAGKILVGNCFL